MRTSGVWRCRMRVKATSFSPPGIFCTNLYVPYLRARGSTRFRAHDPLVSWQRDVDTHFNQTASVQGMPLHLLLGNGVMTDVLAHTDG